MTDDAGIATQLDQQQENLLKSNGKEDGKYLRKEDTSPVHVQTNS